MLRRLSLLAAFAIPLFAQQNCADLAKLALPGTTILQATLVPAGQFTPPGGRASNVPAFCRVAGRVNPEVNFEVWLPEQWNGKFLAVGNGGLAGTISYSAM